MYKYYANTSQLSSSCSDNKGFWRVNSELYIFLYTSVHCDRASGLQVACFEHICCNITVVIVVALCSGLTEPT